MTPVEVRAAGLRELLQSMEEEGKCIHYDDAADFMRRNASCCRVLYDATMYDGRPYHVWLPHSHMGMFEAKYYCGNKIRGVIGSYVISTVDLDRCGRLERMTTDIDARDPRNDVAVRTAR